MVLLLHKHEKGLINRLKNFVQLFDTLWVDAETLALVLLPEFVFPENVLFSFSFAQFLQLVPG